ncbi:hypothetical protein BELL_0215g00180 [Botrytis elliptica]|uniref:Uncharacterized protein n=1 Tax=Botrytis elliptica TaxID=278938 RepID=A0A4Z1JUX1_9HELO|nr:hypothetical protein EAE99_001121 [Botrytis elliptica]TGO75410.1 hypothetical protein BELL_0215g00180 [Botrytis elliptica]
MTLPHFDNDPLSKSCRVYPISKDPSKPEPKPTTRPKIFFEHKGHGCGRVVIKDPDDKCLWNGKEEKQCPDCEDCAYGYKKCAHIKWGPSQKCPEEADLYDRGKPRKHIPHIVLDNVDGFCSDKCTDKQAVRDDEQRILEKNARRKSENEAREKEEAKQDLNFVEDNERNRRAQRPQRDIPSTYGHVSSSSTSSRSSNYPYRRYTNAQLAEIARNTTPTYRNSEWVGRWV